MNKSLHRRPLISVIVPTYNRTHTLKGALASVLNQTYGNIEVIVVDDGSTDNTEQVIESLRDERLVFVRREVNRGAANARNLGISLTKGELIAFQDSDDLWQRDKLEQQVGAIESLPASYGMVYTQMLMLKLEGAILYKSAPGGKREGSLFNWMLCGAAVNIGIQTCLIRRECFDSVGRFDTNLKRFIDLEFFIRLSQHYDIYELPVPLVTYVDSEDSISRNTLDGIEAQKRIMDKYNGYLRRNRRASAYQHFFLGKLFMMHKGYRSAESAFRTAARLHPKPTYLLWALLAHGNGRLYNPARRVKRGVYRVSQRVAKALS